MTTSTDGRLKAVPEAACEDLRDLMEVLGRRFGPLPDDLTAAIRSLTDVQQINRLVLVAANAADLGAFARELTHGSRAFRL